ncbi:hypothetical protein QZH41_012257 [Actinostola sp. cb2023]|nr:hypothetical protein QZH41_012257 [Actinostola sp. cb2023]
MEAVRILAFGDSLTRGYYGRGKEYHPYTEKLEYLLNTDSHKCFVVDNQGKDKEFAADMTKRLENYLQKASTWYKWVIILGGTNDIVHDPRPATEKNWDRVVHDVIMAHQKAHKYGFNTIVVTIPEIDCEQSDKPNCKRIHKERLYVNERLRHYAMETSAAILSDLAWLLPRYAFETEKRIFYWETGLHMKPQGYDRMAEIIYEDVIRNLR